MKKELLMDSESIRFSIEESEDGKFVARGEFGRCDVPTANGRVYSRKLYEREIKKLQPLVENRRMYGELDHPSDGKTLLQRVSHIITELKVEDDGRVTGTAEIMDTPMGQTLKAILKAGGEVGVSSRGFGSTRSKQDGTQTVGEDFVLKTFDFVADPAMKSAYPQVFVEDTEINLEPVLESEFPELIEKIRAEEREIAETAMKKQIEELLNGHREKVADEFREDFERKLLSTVSEVRESVETTVKTELMENPQFGGAKAILSKVAELVSAFGGVANEDGVATADLIKAKDMEISALEQTLEQTKDLAKRAVFGMKAEELIGGHVKAESIRKVLGDYRQYENVSQLIARIDELKSEYDEFVEMEENVRNHRHETEKAELKTAFETKLREIELKVSNSMSNNDKEVEIRDARIAELESELDVAETSNEKMQATLERRLERALDVAEQYKEKVEELEEIAEEYKMKSYKSERTNGFSNRSNLLKMLDEARSETAVDEIIDSAGRRGMSDPNLEHVRQRLQKSRKREQRESLNEDANTTASEIGIMSDMDFSRIQALAGIRKP